MSYTNTFILVAPDSPAEFGTAPADKKEGRTKPSIELELLVQHPYKYTEKELIYEVHIRHKGIPEQEAAEREEAIKQELFAKPHPCLRASMLPKKYGWGIHYNADGRIAAYPMESPAYRQFADGAVEGGRPTLLFAMRNKRKS